MDENERRNMTLDEEEIMRQRMNERRQANAQRQRAAQAKKQKQRQIGKKAVLISKIALAVIVVLSLLFIAARSLGNITFSKAADYISQSFSNLKPGDGYPVQMGSGTVDNMTSLGGNLAVLRDDGLILLNSTAKEINSYQHSYSKPVLNCISNRFLLTDRTTGRFFIADSNEVLFESQLEKEVFCSTLGEKGNFAFSCAADDAASVLKVYSSSYDNEFTFKCSEEYIISASISQNGKYIAAVGIGSKNAAVYSTVYIIDIKDQKVLSQLPINAAKVNTIYFTENDIAVAVAESSYYIIEIAKDKAEIVLDNKVENHVIASFTPCENGCFSMVFTKFGSIDSDILVFFDSSGKEKFNIETKTNVDCVDVSDKYVCFTDSNNIVYSYNYSGKLIGKTQLDMNAQQLTVIGKYAYALCYGDLLRLDVKNDIE